MTHFSVAFRANFVALEIGEEFPFTLATALDLWTAIANACAFYACRTAVIHGYSPRCLMSSDDFRQLADYVSTLPQLQVALCTNLDDWQLYVSHFSTLLENGGPLIRHFRERTPAFAWLGLETPESIANDGDTRNTVQVH